MTLELTQAEHDLLLEFLTDRLGELRDQVHHARTSTFKDELRGKEETLKGLIAKLETVGGE